MKAEIWSQIEGFEGHYEISSHGRVRSFVRGNGSMASTHHTVRPFIGYGYIRYSLSLRGKSTNHFAHRLVAHAFIGPCPKGHEVNHKNGKRDDPHVENLEYVTRHQNAAHAYAVLGRKAPHGVLHWNKKLNDADVLAIRIARSNKQSLTQIASDFGISVASVSMIANRKTWTHI